MKRLHEHSIWKRGKQQLGSGLNPDYVGFCECVHEVTRSIPTNPWIGCWSITGLPPILYSPVPIYIPE